jgi:membrane protein implicated in regulation of membrane protease activity
MTVTTRRIVPPCEQRRPRGHIVTSEVPEMVIVWVLIAVVLVAVELHHLAFFAMFGALGAAAAAVVALIAPSAVPVQIGVAIAVAAIGVRIVRPFMSRAFAHAGPGVRIGGVHGGLIAARGVTLDEVGSHDVGHVKLLGEKWLAVADFGPPIPASTQVIVTKVVGTTLTVRVAEELELS